MCEEYEDNEVIDYTIIPVVKTPHLLKPCKMCGTPTDTVYCDIYCKRDYESVKDATE